MNIIHYEQLIGLTEEEAQVLTEKTIRAKRIDGENLIVTCDYNLDRLNVELTNGKITAILGLG